MRSARIVIALSLAALIGCKGADDTSGVPGDTAPLDSATDAEPALDGDGDGITSVDGDCDDANPNIYPGRLELCNGVDDNCNGVMDEGTADADGDGTCDAMDEEECDGLDNDGDGRVDEDFGDADRDGIADCADGEECDGIDNNGDGDIDEGYDADEDGYSQCGELGTVDCDDADAAVNPGASEASADVVDNDCDGIVDEEDWAEGDVVITEVMRNPQTVSDPAGEWFEVYNASDRVLALNGLSISDETIELHLVSASEVLALEPGEYAVLGANGDYATNGSVNVDYVYQDISLGNERDSLALSIVHGPDVLRVDELRWDETDFPTTAGASMALDPQYTGAAENDLAENWCSATEEWGSLMEAGSPGTANPGCATVDHDGDGQSAAEGDCDDEDPLRYLDAPEVDPAIDEDCDGDAEVGPVAVVALGPGSDAEACGQIQLDGSATYDPDGIGPFEYSWTLEEAPAASERSSADIDDADLSVAWFEPDVDGLYTFWLTAWDSGDARSEPAPLEVDVAARVGNNAPQADAGGSFSTTGVAVCNGDTIGAGFDCKPCEVAKVSLDGSGTLDPDGDRVHYSWRLLAGNGSISDPTAEMPELQISGPVPAASGEVAEEVIYIGLEVTDCMGSTSAEDIITVTYECTGG